MYLYDDQDRVDDNQDIFYKASGVRVIIIIATLTCTLVCNYSKSVLIEHSRLPCPFSKHCGYVCECLMATGVAACGKEPAMYQYCCNDYCFPSMQRLQHCHISYLVVCSQFVSSDPSHQSLSGRLYKYWLPQFCVCRCNSVTPRYENRSVTDASQSTGHAIAPTDLKKPC